MYKVYFFSIAILFTLLYMLSLFNVMKAPKNLYFSLTLCLIGVPFVYKTIGNYSSLDLLSLPKIRGQITENRKIRPLITSVERRTAKMGMLCDIEPDKVDNWWQYGQLLELQQRNYDAIQIYKKAIEIHKGAVPILERIILLSLKLNEGLTNDSINDFAKKIVEVEQDNMIAKHAKALSLYQSGKFSESAIIWTDVLSGLEKNDSSYSGVMLDIEGMIKLANKLDKEPNISLQFHLNNSNDNDYVFVSLKKATRDGPPLLAYRSMVGELPNILRLSSLFSIEPSFDWDNIIGKDVVLEVFTTEKSSIDSSAQKVLSKTISLELSQLPFEYSVEVNS